MGAEVIIFTQFLIMINDFANFPKGLTYGSMNHTLKELYLLGTLWCLWDLGKGSWKKAAVLLDFVQITYPQFGQFVQLFLNAQNVD